MAEWRHPVDAEAHELLARADEHVHADRALAGVEAFEQAGARFLAENNALGAIVAHQRALQILMRDTAHAELKTRISAELEAALSALGLEACGSPEERVRALFRAAARYWSDAPHEPDGHRALCFACRALKPTAWLRCAECGARPDSPTLDALSLLLSERVAPLASLPRHATTPQAPGEPGVLSEAARLLATHLYRTTHQIHPDAALVPGTIVTALSMDRRAAVVLEVSTGVDFIADKEACAEFLRGICESLLAAPAGLEVDELPWQDGKSVRQARVELEHRFGSKILFERWRRLEVESGRVGSACIAATLPDPRPSSGRHHRFSGNQAAALVALRADQSIGRRGEPQDLAEQLARQAAATDFADAVPKFRELKRETGFVEDALERRLELLRELPFDGDPSLTVGTACELLSHTLKGSVALAAASRYARRAVVDGDPSHFPGEAALRA